MQGTRFWRGLAVVAFAAGVAAAAGRQAALLERNYNGSFPDTFTNQFDRVRLLVRQAQLEISARLGLLQYREGFQYPLDIRFDDGAPPGLEHALAYVRLGRSPEGFRQQLVVNLSQAAHNPFDFDQVFYHEMTHAVLNDAVGGDASMRVPPWVQEGLAQYASGEGDRRVKTAAAQFRRSQASALAVDLEGPYSGFSYPQYYLAIRYMADRMSSNAVQALVRLLISGKPLIEAVEESTAMPWPRFKEKLREYSVGVFQRHAQPDF